MGPGPGTYLDIGAGNPVVGSNTYHFYRKGWRGIGVDASDYLSSAWRLVRPKDKFIQAAVSAAVTEIKFFEFENDLKSTVMDSVRNHYLAQGKNVVEKIVKTVSLQELLPTTLSSEEKFFLSIDVEGAELDVLTSADLKIKRPRIIAIESWMPPWLEENQISAHLRDKRFELIGYTGLTAFYMPIEIYRSLISTRLNVGV
jgi:FkbM family methyltransferase